MYRDVNPMMVRDFVFALICFQFGMRGPTMFVLPLMMGGGMTLRPIPFQVTMAGDVLLDLTLSNVYVSKSDVAFPSERLFFISLWLPLSIVVLLGSFFPLVPVSASRHHHLPATIAPSSNNPLSNAHAGTCAVLVGIGISEFVTQTAKFYVGRLRPNFYAMCGFDASTLRCTNGIEMETEARLSFPSGHSSLSFAGSVCLVLFLLGRCGLGRSDRRHSFGGGGRSGGGGDEGVAMASGRRRMAFAASFAPLLLSFWCATSRLVDNWHHPSDILAGSIVGTVSAFVSYHIWFPHVLSVHSGIPLSVISSAMASSKEDGPGGDPGMTTGLLAEKSLSLPSFNVA